MKSIYVAALFLSLFLSFSASASTIWPSTSVPSVLDSGPDSAVEIGVKFRADVAGTVSGIRFYKASTNTGTHIGNLWSSTGSKLASATFTNETASGWQQVNFSTPITIAANTVYVASYHTNVGYYSDDQSYFANAGIDNPPLHALKNGESGYDGVYAYGSSSAFPSNGWNSSNYWVDVVFTAGQTPQPISVSLIPTSATIQVNGSQQFTATVVGTSNQTVTWTVDGGAISSTGLYTAPSTAGTYHVVATSVVDTTKSATAAVIVTATSASASTIWSSTSVPSVPDSGPDSAVEIGVKFRADVAGTVNGIRFYKGTGNTGTHVGNLWARTGSKLASATFTNETAFGWQQVNFSTPVEITVNTVYVASYHANAGHYSADQNYFASAGVNTPPLHALANGVSGADGVYAYGSSSAFPSNGWNSSNYWVDVVFTAGQTPISVALIPTSAVIQIGGSQQFTATVGGTTNQTVTWTVDGGTISSSGLYTAPSTAGTYHVVATSVADTTKTATASVIVMAVPPPPTTIFYDDFNGTALNSNWTVISRHGEYTQSETECNIPQEVAVANSVMTITTAAQNWVCGDFYPDGSVWHTPRSWPYITGDIQWSGFNFTYGTVEIRAKFPDSRSNTWPATWLLGSNCQATNPYTGNTGVGTCPNVGQAGYTEIDMTECFNTTSPWCQFHVSNPGFGIGGGCDAVYPTVDTNWHVYDTVWTASSIKQYMDGVLVSTCNQRLGNPMFLIIQTQTGGVSGTPNSAYLPATLSIDYVKVTQP